MWEEVGGKVKLLAGAAEGSNRKGSNRKDSTRKDNSNRENSTIKRTATIETTAP